MKVQFLNILSCVSKCALALALVANISSCDSVIYDYEDKCDPEPEQPGPGPDAPDEPKPEPTVYYVEYIFDKNMQYTDGFSSNVNSVDLYVFNTSGTFVTKYHEEGAPLTQKGYLMELTDLPAGTYQMVAWCGANAFTNFFSIPSSISRRTDVTAELNVEDGCSNVNLPSLFHGALDNATYTDAEGAQIYTIRLTKDTNNINITMQHRAGLEFRKDRFKVWITDNNGFMLADNTVPDGNEDVEYRPYRTAIGTTTVKSSVTRADDTVGNFLLVELATARLMADHAATITVIDTENNDKVIFSIPLVRWALQLRSSNHKTMDEQEYLDRQDEYNMMLWLDSYDPETGESTGWFGAGVEILDWHVIDDVQNLQ